MAELWIEDCDGLPIIVKGDRKTPDRICKFEWDVSFVPSELKMLQQVASYYDMRGCSRGIAAERAAQALRDKKGIAEFPEQGITVTAKELRCCNCKEIITGNAHYVSDGDGGFVPLCEDCNTARNEALSRQQAIELPTELPPDICPQCGEKMVVAMFMEDDGSTRLYACSNTACANYVGE